MSEAHEKTRIRQSEDAAAHWEHKYANARQYNRNLEERNQRLEAALREIAAGLMPEDSAAYRHNRYELCAARLCEIARRAITSETKADQASEDTYTNGTSFSDKTVSDFYRTPGPYALHPYEGSPTVDRGETCLKCGMDMNAPMHTSKIVGKP